MGTDYELHEWVNISTDHIREDTKTKTGLEAAFRFSIIHLRNFLPVCSGNYEIKGQRQSRERGRDVTDDDRK